jgi:hypothetical protein
MYNQRLECAAEYIAREALSSTVRQRALALFTGGLLIVLGWFRYRD